MATADWKAVVTTEIRVSLSKISEEDIGKVIGTKYRNLRSIESETNTRIEFDKRNLDVFIFGEPKAAKLAHSLLMGRIELISQENTSHRPDTIINLLGAEFTEAVAFCKFIEEDSTYEQDEERVKAENAQRREGRRFVLHPVTGLQFQEVCTSRYWVYRVCSNVQFMLYDFRSNVILDASMSFVRRCKELVEGKMGKSFKVEVGSALFAGLVYLDMKLIRTAMQISLGKVVFNEMDRENFALDEIKLVLDDFQHLRLNKEITKIFREKLGASWASRLRTLLPKLGYSDCYIKNIVTINHLEQKEDGTENQAVWTAKPSEAMEGGLLNLVKARTSDRCVFLNTLCGPTNALDLFMKLFVAGRESDEVSNEIDNRLRRSFLYTPEHGFLINSELGQPYPPLVDAFGKYTRETTFLRGDIKLILVEVIHGTTVRWYEVRMRSGTLKKLARKSSAELDLQEVVAALTELCDAAEEIKKHLYVKTTPDSEKMRASLPIIQRPHKKVAPLKNESDAAEASTTWPAVEKLQSRLIDNGKKAVSSEEMVKMFRSKAAAAGVTIATTTPVKEKKEGGFNNALKDGVVNSPTSYSPDVFSPRRNTDVEMANMLGFIDYSSFGVSAPNKTLTKNPSHNFKENMPEPVCPESPLQRKEASRASNYNLSPTTVRPQVDEQSSQKPPHSFKLSPLSQEFKSNQITYNTPEKLEQNHKYEQRASEINNTNSPFTIIDSPMERNISIPVIPVEIRTPSKESPKGLTRKHRSRIDFFDPLGPVERGEGSGGDLICWSPKKPVFIDDDDDVELDGGDLLLDL
ncbi:hypothetical protein RUND412_009409 [Rhizina undulata]